jgi:uncharacterized membrane protein
MGSSQFQAGEAKAMADRTRGSIEVAAPVARVMAVIADLPAYPEWTSEVKKAEVLSVDPDSDRAETDPARSPSKE